MTWRRIGSIMTRSFYVCSKIDKSHFEKRSVPLQLNLANLHKLPKNYALPAYDITQMQSRTKAAPVWIHFGAGNIFRMFPAMMQQTLLNNGLAESGIVVCESYDEELVEKIFTPYDNLTAAITLKADGAMEKTIVASIAECLAASQSIDRLTDIFTNHSLQMVSFTITEKGYAIHGADGTVLPFIASDIEAGPDGAKSLMGLITRLAYVRYNTGALPIAFVSMDNCSHNGDKLRDAVLFLASGWLQAGFVDNGFLAYLQDTRKVGFPLSMIDKITPRPSDSVRDILAVDGLCDVEPVVTAKNTYAACFVNAEEVGYLVVEDVFPNGKPALDKAGVIFTDRATVDKVEKMKVCTCLNPLHTALAVFGCLLGHTSISGEMSDTNLRRLVEHIGYEEGLPVVVNPGIINPQTFIDEVLTKRFPNPFVPDTPQRIACDTSQKIPVRFGETLKAYVAKGEDISKLTYIPLFFAGWLRYLMAVDDAGNAFTPSPDPLLEELQIAMSGVMLGGGDYTDALSSILRNASIFGVDLCAHGLQDIILGFFNEMNAGAGAVAKTLAKYV